MFASAAIAILVLAVPTLLLTTVAVVTRDVGPTVAHGFPAVIVLPAAGALTAVSTVGWIWWSRDTGPGTPIVVGVTGCGIAIVSATVWCARRPVAAAFAITAVHPIVFTGTWAVISGIGEYVELYVAAILIVLVLLVLATLVLGVVVAQIRLTRGRPRPRSVVGVSVRP